MTAFLRDVRVFLFTSKTEDKVLPALLQAVNWKLLDNINWYFESFVFKLTKGNNFNLLSFTLNLNKWELREGTSPDRKTELLEQYA